VGLDRDFVIVIRLTVLNSDRSLWALAEAGAQTVAKTVAYQFGLTIDNLDSAFSAGGHTIAAAIALLFVYVHNLSNRHIDSFRRLRSYQSTRISSAGSFSSLT
jgi:hypothetical protein